LRPIRNDLVDFEHHHGEARILPYFAVHPALEFQLLGFLYLIAGTQVRSQGSEARQILAEEVESLLDFGPDHVPRGDGFKDRVSKSVLVSPNGCP